jgi:hypothetical protein
MVVSLTMMVMTIKDMGSEKGDARLTLNVLDSDRHVSGNTLSFFSSFLVQSS